MTVILIILMVACYTMQSLFAKYYALSSDDDSPNASLVFATLFGLTISLTTFFTGGMSFSPSPVTVICGSANAVMLVIFHLSQIGASTRGSYAIQMLCLLFGGILIPMTSSTILLSQRLVWYQITALVILLVAFLLLNIEGASLSGAKKGYWVFCILLFLSNGLFGAFNSYQANMSPTADRTEMITIAYLGSAILASLSILLRGGPKAFSGFKLPKKAAFFAVASCIVATAAINISLYLYSVVNTTVLASIDNGGVLITTTTAAIWLFGERPSKLQYAGLFLALCSLILFSIPA